MARLLMLAVALVAAVVSHAPPASAGHQAKGAASMSSTIAITIGTKTFMATLVENEATAAFRRLLPLSVTMTELNGNEKLFRLSSDLPTQSSRPASIRTGDLMLYGSNTIVLFYKSFPTTYSYTRLGRIDDVRGLEAALGAGSVDVTFHAPDAGVGAR